MTVAPTTPQTFPVIATGLPFIGTIDFNRGPEFVYWGALLADLILIPGVSKWIVGAGILALRYELSRLGTEIG